MQKVAVLLFLCLFNGIALNGMDKKAQIKINALRQQRVKALEQAKAAKAAKKAAQKAQKHRSHPHQSRSMM